MLKTYKTGKVKNIVILTVIIIFFGVSILSIVWANSIKNEKLKFVPPPFDSNIQIGMPSPPAHLAYSSLKPKEQLEISVCSNLKTNNSDIVDIYLTNLESNKVWVMMKLINLSNNEELGRTGLIKPGEYLKSLNLYNNIEDDMLDVNMELVFFEPETYYSEGTVNLNAKLQN